MNSQDVERARDHVISVIHGIDGGELEASQDQWNELLAATFVLAGIAQRNTSEPPGLPLSQDDVQVGETVLMVKWTGQREKDGSRRHVFREAKVLDIGEGSVRVRYSDGSLPDGRTSYEAATVELKMLRPMSHIEFRTPLTTPNPGRVITDPEEVAVHRARYWELTGAPPPIPISEQEMARTSANTHLWTKIKQEKLVGEGLAIPCLNRSLATITRSDSVIQAAFRTAWCRSHWLSRFPKVYGSLSAIFDRSTNRRGEVMVVWYAAQETYRPHLVQYWEHEEFINRLEAAAGIPYREWLSFADAFIAELRDEHVRRTT